MYCTCTLYRLYVGTVQVHICCWLWDAAGVAEGTEAEAAAEKSSRDNISRSNAEIRRNISLDSTRTSVSLPDVLITGDFVKIRRKHRRLISPFLSAVCHGRRVVANEQQRACLQFPSLLTLLSHTTFYCGVYFETFISVKKLFASEALVVTTRYISNAPRIAFFVLIAGSINLWSHHPILHCAVSFLFSQSR